MDAPDPSSKTGPPRQASFEDLLVEALGVLEDGGSVALEQLLERRPEHATALRQRIAELGRLGLVDTASAREGARAERLGDFRLIAELGGGGMGVVYEAEQESLGRRVALKLIRPELLWFGGSRARFRREIEAVARLSHPGIVPIYTVGEEKGVPFFAMELIEGCTLAQVITHLAEKTVTKLRGADFLQAVEHCARATGKGTDSSTASGISPDATWTVVSIRIVRQIAEALEHAHSRGVVHRDVKPSNIVLTRTGRAMLIDFGLATREGGERITRSGSAGGSAAYMSPEQVRGNEVDARTDVYSLGVTFAELLTLRPVFSSASMEAHWRAILDGDYERPRTRVATIPWDVETVCTTAMEADRERRYATAGELALDLSNLIARRPIEARRAGAMLRGLRWAQRHPRISAAVLAGSALGLIGALFYARQQSVLGDKIAEQRDVARSRADELRKLATSFVFDVDEKLRRLPGSTEAREQIVTQAQSLFDALARARADDPTLARDLAFADLRLGTMLNKTSGGTLGQQGSAGEHLESSWRYFDANARAATSSLADRRLLVQAEMNFGNHLTNNGDPERGKEILLRGCEDARVLAALAEATLEDQVDALRIDLELTLNHAHLGRTEDAQRGYEQAVTRLEELDRLYPSDVLVLRWMPRAFALFADALEQAGEIERARTIYGAGVAAGDRLIAAEPLSPLNRRWRANCLEGLAGVLDRLGDEAQARKNFGLALAEFTALQREDPLETQGALDLARASCSLSDLLKSRSRLDEALLAAQAALAALDGLPPKVRTREVIRRRLSILQSLGAVESQLDRIDAARAHFGQGDALATELCAEDANDIFTLSNAAQILSDWACMELAAGDSETSVALHRRSMQSYGRWRELAPRHGVVLADAGLERTLFAKALGANGDGEESVNEHRLACEETEASIDVTTADALVLERGGFILISGAAAIAENGDAPLSRRLLEVALGYLERALELDPSLEFTRVYWIAGVGMLAEDADERGAKEEALEWARKSLEQRATWAREESAPAIDLVLVAEDYLASPRESLRDPARALELVRLAVSREPLEAVPQYWLAKALRANGDDAAALEAARAALALVPTALDPSAQALVDKLTGMIAELEPALH